MPNVTQKKDMEDLYTLLTKMTNLDDRWQNHLSWLNDKEFYNNGLT